MSLFEFVTVMVSMILALCLGQLLRGASFLAKTEQKVTYHLPHTLWSLVIFLAVINQWWSLWDLRDVNWSYASFLYILAAPVLITFATGLLMPTLSNSVPVDLQAHYTRIRRLFSATFVAYVGFMWFDGPLFADQELFGTVGMMHVPIIVVSLVPGLSESRRANAIAASVGLVNTLVLMAVRYSTM